MIMATINLLDFTENDTKVETKTDTKIEPKNNKVIGKVHLSVQKRNAKKYITSIDGLPVSVDRKELLRAWKVKYSCNGSFDPKEDKLILTGDQRENIIKYLLEKNITTAENIEVHGC